MSRYRQTICWECSKACGGCCWSDKNQRTPVPGWTAERTRLRLNNNLYGESYVVYECPEFERDAYKHGEKRLKSVQPW